MSAGRLTADGLVLLLGGRPPRGTRRWIYDGLRLAIQSGRIEAATVLPSSRSAATALGVARGSVTEALDMLVGEGFLETKHRSGVLVATRGQTVPGRALRIVAPPVASPGLPDPRLFPRAEWGRATRVAVLQATDDQLGYPDPQGLLTLRQELAGLVRRTRGAQVDASQVIVVGGVAQALTLLGAVLAARGTQMVAVEEPGSPGVWSQLTGTGITVAPTRTDADGLVVNELNPTAGAVVVTPAHQYPLGVVLAPHRRRELTVWAAKDDRLILEDDYDAELRYDRNPVGALQAMAPDRVLLMGSVSKTLSPALRLGWIIAPDHLINELVAVKRHNDLGTSTFEQLPMQTFLANGTYERHVRRTREEYQRRRVAILEVLNESFPGMPVAGVQAGLHLVLLLPDADIQTGIVDALRAQGVATQPLSASYQLTPRFGAVIGTARITPNQIREAARELGTRRISRSPAGR